MLLFDNVIEELATLAVFKHEEANIVPFPDLVKLDYIRVVQDSQNVNLIDKSLKIFNLFLLNGLDCELGSSLPVLSKVDEPKAS